MLSTEKQYTKLYTCNFSRGHLLYKASIWIISFKYENLQFNYQDVILLKISNNLLIS